MTTPMIFYLLITGIIGALQVFGNFYALRNGICDEEINFIVIKIHVPVNFRAVRVFDDGAHDAVDVHAAAVDNQARVVLIDYGRLIDNVDIDGRREIGFRLVFERQKCGVRK